MKPALPATSPSSVDRDARREAQALEVFTRRGSAPKATFALVLVSVTIASLSMSLDAVDHYSKTAFVVGLALAAALALGIARLIDLVREPLWRTAATLTLPALCGGAIGMVVQSIVLAEVGSSWSMAVKDLGGLVDTTQPVPWVLSGMVLGGMPALVVTAFLVLASRALKRLAGHDASENFGVAFIGAAGLVSAFGLLVAEGMAQAPLFVVTIASGITVLLAVLIDGSRISFLRRVYAKNGSGYDVVPADQFANDPTLAPMVANAGSGSVLVRVPTTGYRGAAMEPIALVADSEEETLRPLLRRRAAGAILLVATAGLSGLAVLLHG